MMNISFERSATAMALGLAVASAAIAPAKAAVVTWTFSGTVADGFDTTGLFGAPNSILSGDAYSITYSFDTSGGTLTEGMDASSLQGGAAPTGPFSAAVLTIKGVGVSISGVQSYGSDFAITTDAVDYNEMEASIGGGDLNTSYSYAFNATNGVAASSASFDKAFHSSGVSSICLDSSCNDFYAGSFGFNESLTQAPTTFGVFDVDGTTKVVATVSGAGGVPEPSTWALMLVGIGGLGAVLRGSRRLGAITA